MSPVAKCDMLGRTPRGVGLWLVRSALVVHGMYIFLAYDNAPSSLNNGMVALLLIVCEFVSDQRILLRVLLLRYY